ncbi:MAG: prepilin-type N-terminal cleavage/methylation domain-containing protein [Clostridia bacterium]
MKKIKENIKTNKKSARRNYSNQKGITLIALVVTIVVLLILAGVSVNAIFSENGIIKRAKDAQNKMDQAAENDQKGINELSNWLDSKINGNSGGNTTGGNTTGGDDTSTTQKISTLVGKVVDKNTKAEDAYGNKITIPKGFKVLAKGTSTESASYTYSGNNIPAVQDGIVIENGTDGNQFVWVPVGTIKNKDGSTNTITLGRYSNFAKQNGTYVPAQNANNCTQEVTINTYFKELSTFREGNTATDSTAQNATARNLAEFISTSLSNGGYYIARFEASGTASKITSKYNQTVLGNITQPNAAKVAREMYGEVKENNELVYASDLVNSYAWDTAIIFIQTYSTETDASSYASQNKSTSFANTGKSNDKYCNIFDMSGNADEWTTEYSTYSSTSHFYPCVHRGGYYDTDIGEAYCYTSNRYDDYTTDSHSYDSLRSLLYVK